MKIYISCDAEGIGSIAEWEQCGRNKKDYNIGRELMVGEVNAAIEGALAGGAKSIVVCDSHEKMINLEPEKLHPAAQLVQGSFRAMSMVTGLDNSFDAAMFIGYHSMSGTQGGTLSHTYTSILTDVIINGKNVGEPELNAMMAGWFGVPLIFLAGDEAATKEIKRFIPKIETVATKKALGRRASMSRHPEENRARIKKGAEKALTKIKQIKPLVPRKPIKLGVNFWMVDMADVCEVIPGVKRTGSRSVEYKSDSYWDIYGMFLTIMRVAAGAND
jgi:D-amino peptidase